MHHADALQRSRCMPCDRMGDRGTARCPPPRTTRRPLPPLPSTNTDVPQYTEGTGDRPPWTGGGLLSGLANLAIATPPIYALLTRAARAVLKRGAQRQGIEWDATVERLRNDPAVSTVPPQPNATVYTVAGAVCAL